MGEIRCGIKGVPDRDEFMAQSKRRIEEACREAIHGEAENMAASMFRRLSRLLAEQERKRLLSVSRRG